MFWLSLFFSVTICHICSIYPPQRGDLNVNDPGDPTCYWRTPYCGGKPFNGKVTPFIAGAKADFLFQQNLNHWNATNPGWIDVSISFTDSPNDQDWSLLVKIDDYPAFDEVTQTNFSVSITIPNKPASHAILRFRYQSNNNDEVDHNTTIFYNCADIQIIAVPNSDFVPPIKTMPVRESESASYVCNTPPYWSISGVEAFNNGRDEVSHDYYYDYYNNRTAWHRKSKNFRQILINDYNTLIEYVIDPIQRTCAKYGGDKFYGWNYGTLGMNYDSNLVAPPVLSWSNPNGHTWLATRLNKYFCAPHAHIKQFSTMVFGDINTTAYDSNIFTPPKYCFGKLVQPRGCSPRKKLVH